MQMQIMSKNQIIENYAEEIEKLNNRMRQLGGGDGSNFDINAIYTDIENLNKTIEHLKKENQKLRQSLNAFNGNAESDLKEGGERAEVDNLVDKLNSLEKRIKAGPQDGLDIKQSKQAQRVSELENEQYKLTRQIVDFEEASKLHKREVESLENERTKLKDCLDRIHEDHEALKAKSIDLLKRNGHIETENESLRKEKAQLVDSILALQKSHSDELNSLRSTLESLGEKLYVVGLDTENKQTFTDLDNRHNSEKRAWTEKNRILQETCEHLQRENQTMEAKIEEQHNVINMYARVESTLQEEQRKLKKLEAEFDKLSDNYANLEGERDEALAQIRSLERDHHQTKEEKLQAHHEINELQKHKGDLHRHKTDLEEKVKSIEAEIDDLREKLRAVETDKRAQERTISQFKTDSLRTNDVLKLSKEEITNLQESLTEKRREMETLEKDRNFLKKKVERLEDQLFQKEKKFLREEAEREIDSEERVRRLMEENDSLKEELISKV
jgi:chromosome segregation ATPase